MENYLVFKDGVHMDEVVKSLLEEEYVVMISREDEFYVVSYLYVPGSDRNKVVFRTIEEQEEIDEELIDAFINDLREDGKLK